MGQEVACEVEPPGIANCRLLGDDISTIEPPEYFS